MIRGAIFDADGTLLDSMPMWSGVGSGYLRSLGIEPRDDVDERFRDMSLYQSAVYLKEEYELQLSLDEIAAGINKMVDHLYAETVPMKAGVVDVLEGLRQRGVKMCVATASEAYQISMALERCGTAHYFEKVMSCVDVGHGKDEPIIFRMAQELLGTEKNETFVFEDAVYAAKTATADGYNVVGVYDESVGDPSEMLSLASHYINDYRKLDEFWKYIDTL